MIGFLQHKAELYIDHFIRRVFVMKSFRSTGIVNIFGIWLLFLIGGCSSNYVSSDYDPAVDRSRYVTYSWSPADQDGAKEDDPSVSPFVYNRIHLAVDRELAARGYELKKSDPVDFTVEVHVKKALRSAFYQDPFYYSYPRFYPRNHFRHQFYLFDPWWDTYGYDSYVRYYEEDFLMIDIIDGRTNKPAWRGSAWGTFQPNPDSETIQKNVDRSVSNILEKFSPLKKAK
jgi:hypothetical protein